MINKTSIYENYDPSVIAIPEKDTPSYWFVFCENKLLITDNTQNHYLPFVENSHDLNLPIDRTHYIGTLFEAPCYCSEVSNESIIPSEMSFMGLRALHGVLDENIYLLAGRAFQILTWDKSHQYCSKCGTLVEKLDGEFAKVCPKCHFRSYPRISPAIITAIIKGDQILLAHNNSFKGNMYSLIAGFAEPGETLEECVEREIMEEVNIKVKNIQYFGSQSWPYPHSMMIGFTAEYDSGDICVDGVEIDAADWFDRDNLPEIPGPLSIARKIIDSFVNK